MPTRTENVEMTWSRSWLISKLICITASANPEALNLGEADTGCVQ